MAFGVASLLGACRPDGVPRDAKGGFTVLNGQTWAWRDETEIGPIRWQADHHGLSLSIDAGSGPSSPRSLGVPSISVSYNDEGRLRISSLRSSPGAGRPCEIMLSENQIGRVEDVLREAVRHESHPVRERMLLGAASQIRELDQGTLVTDGGGGCVMAP